MVGLSAVGCCGCCLRRLAPWADRTNLDDLAGCSYEEDKWGVKAVIETWLDEQSLGHLPVFALGVSAGASFALKLPKVTRINGVVSGETAIRGCFAVGCGWGNAGFLRHAIMPTHSSSLAPTRRGAGRDARVL